MYCIREEVRSHICEEIKSLYFPLQKRNFSNDKTCRNEPHRKSIFLEIQQSRGLPLAKKKVSHWGHICFGRMYALATPPWLKSVPRKIHS